LEKVYGIHVYVLRPLPDETRKLADDPEVMKREMRMIQRESWKVGKYWEC